MRYELLFVYARVARQLCLSTPPSRPPTPPPYHHHKPKKQRCLSAMIARDCPGYAIGGLAGGESKDAFWRVVAQGAAGLPDDKPRYLMGVGYPLDLVVCTALGVDMYVLT